MLMQQVDSRLLALKETVAENKTFLDERVCSMEGINADTKRKWQDFFMQAGDCTKDNADFSAAKHCRMEKLMQEW